jgi:hypothetical protein
MVVVELRPSAEAFVYHQVKHSNLLRPAHILHFSVLHGFQNKQQFFPCTALTDWFL